MKVIDIITNCMLLMGGLGVFMFGLSVMGDSLENFAGNRLRSIFEKLTGSKTKGVLLGAGGTALIQSSSATTVIVVGFVNAGLMTLSQAAPVIMGANIGTTITVFIMSLPVTEFIAAAGCIGAFMCAFSKRDKVKKVARIFAGLGLIFVGMLVMSNSMVPFRSEFQHFFTVTTNPLLLLLIGLAFTALVQSSAATTGIMLALAATIGDNGASVITISTAMYVLLGVNIGTCITAWLASLGTTANARRTALIHIMFNTVGAVFFLILLVINPIKNAVVSALSVIPEVGMQIAVFHIIFNVLTTLLLMPTSELLVKAACVLIRDDKPAPQTEEHKMKYLNDLILSSPTIAVAQIKKEIQYMSSLAGQNYLSAIAAILNKDLTEKTVFYDREKHINFLNRKIAEYLVKISALDISFRDEQMIGSFYHVVSDIERIGDYSENIIKYTTKMVDNEIVFSDAANAEVTDMNERVIKLYGITVQCFDKADLSKLPAAEEVEDTIDNCKKQYSYAHIKRLNEGVCSAQNGQIFFSLISNMERIADHMINICKSVHDYMDK